MTRFSFFLFVLFLAGPGTSFPALAQVITHNQPGSNAERFTKMFDRSDIWLGADGIYSIPLNGNDDWGSANKESGTLFVFSDTMVGTADPETKRFRDANMVNHSAAILSNYEPTQAAEQEHTIRFFYGRNGDLSRTNLFGKRYWLQDGIAIDGKVYLTAMIPGPQWKPTQIDLISVPIASSDTLDWAKATITEKFAAIFAENELYHAVFGIGILDHIAKDGYVYVYGYRDTLRTGQKFLIAARVKPESFAKADEWRFWDGSSPIGPFGEAVIFHRAPEPTEMGPPIYSYNAKAHPHLSAPGLLLISYNVNRLRSLPHTTDDYRPRFIELRISEIK
ncbi:MAG: DUF4185 domain-containing protein [Planctomycetaceae bacterium]|nr:DUF4185 domain-containing protein [Planctomycetaceae bacterium]